jgi:threonine dehydratase
MDLPTYEDVLAARDRIAGHVVRTPMLRNALLDQRTGATVLIKPEPLQRTGSFKLRGATNATLKLTEPQRQAGLSRTRPAITARPSPARRPAWARAQPCSCPPTLPP